MTTIATTGRFEGRVGIVTGAGSGVGRATALRLAAEGGSVVVADVRGDAAAETVALIESAGGRALAVTTDVRSEEAVRAMVAAAVDRFGRLDILHNNAAALGPDVYGRDLDIEHLDLEVWEQTLAVNARGVFLSVKHAIAPMRASGGGSIVNTISVAALHGGDDHASYGSSKATIMAFTRYAASAYGPDRIRCNAVAPGLILSETAKAVLSEEQLEEFRIERALPWASDPEDIAASVLWLCSDEARCITGHTLVVDSGIMARRPRDILADWDDARSAAPGARS